MRMMRLFVVCCHRNYLMLGTVIQCTTLPGNSDTSSTDVAIELSDHNSLRGISDIHHSDILNTNTRITQLEDVPYAPRSPTVAPLTTSSLPQLEYTCKMN